jgi:hypothetical protein
MIIYFHLFYNYSIQKYNDTLNLMCKYKQRKLILFYGYLFNNIFYGLLINNRFILFLFNGGGLTPAV